MTDQQAPLEMDVNVHIGGIESEDKEPGTYQVYEYRVVDAPHMLFEVTTMNPEKGELKIDVRVDGPVEPMILKNWFETTIKAIAEKIQ